MTADRPTPMAVELSPAPRGLIRWRAGVIWLVIVADLAWMGVSVLVIPEQPDLPTWAVAIVTLMVASFGLVGALVVTRRPGNPVGWILWGAASAFAVSIAAQDYASISLTAHDGSLPGTVFMAWLSGLSFLPAMIAVVVFVPLLLPDGRLLSPRWRWLTALAIVSVVLGIIANAFAPGPLTNFATIPNPFALEVVNSLQVVISVGNGVGIVLVVPLAITSAVLRFRRGGTRERAQLKWFWSAGALTACCFVAAVLPFGPIAAAGWTLALATISLLPIAIGIAILRYRLYDIDRIISRTLSYAVVTAVLIAVFAGAILLFQAVLAPITGGNTVAVAASTLVVAALFQPLRRRVQAVVDRRFNRARYDAERTVAAFAGRLRDEVDKTTLLDDLDTTVRRSLAPAHLVIWLRESQEGPR